MYVIRTDEYDQALYYVEDPLTLWTAAVGLAKQYGSHREAVVDKRRLADDSDGEVDIEQLGAVFVDPDDICPKTNHWHVPYWKTVAISHDGDDTYVYVDIRCQNCGRSGCVGNQVTLANEVTW